MHVVPVAVPETGTKWNLVVCVEWNTDEVKEDIARFDSCGQEAGAGRPPGLR